MKALNQTKASTVVLSGISRLVFAGEGIDLHGRFYLNGTNSFLINSKSPVCLETVYVNLLSGSH